MNASELTSDQADLADLEAFIAAQIAGWDETAAHGLETYLRSNPGHTARHWKGKSMSCPVPAKAGERAWGRLDAEDVRAAATETTAHLLPRNIRQAAAHDSGLVWNPLARKYHLRQPCDRR